MPNALAQETSPYLLQHADNPVQWLPWGEAAFAKARAEQKPIFLSIGYSTCHWCHVMAHESFEDADIAALLNADYVPVKVDREERPDVDKVYMTYVQAMTGHGGWPLSAWLTPELKPFYGGTYFPPEDRQGRPGFPTILKAIAKGWAADRAKLVAESDRVIKLLSEQAASDAKSAAAEGSGKPVESLSEAGASAFEKCFQYFYENFDAQNGGFGGAPKFPRAANLNFISRVVATQGLESEAGAAAARMAAITLRKMIEGGIHDHIGGGFHRYSVDDAWFVPHFEKMLYDQAQIVVNALEVRQATGDERFGWIVHDILEYVLRDLTSPEGGFYTAEDADSVIVHGKPEHAEGAFYVWTEAELKALLPVETQAFFAAHYGVLGGGNVPPEQDPYREFTGKNILKQRRPLAESAKLVGWSVETANSRLVEALELLRVARAQRPRPLRDDKVLTANNGLMISAFAQAARMLPPDDRTKNYLATARRAAEFVERELYDAAQGKLFRSWRGTRGSAEAFAEDYAFLVQGLIDLYEASFESRWLRWAQRLQTEMDARFWDAANGGYFNSAENDASIVLRLKEDYDGAEPAPSSIAAMNLLRLGAIFDESGAERESYRARAVRCVEAFRSKWTATPHALPQMLCAMEVAVEPPRHVVIVGETASPAFRALAAVLSEKPGPRRALIAVNPADPSNAWLTEKLPWAAAMTAIDGKPTAYVCENFACQAPVNQPGALRGLL